jgi:uncharacterized protein YecE (DUF72 family)
MSNFPTPSAAAINLAPAPNRELKIGVCGFCLPQARLFAEFKLIEIQQTFYKPPQLKTVERWRRDAPADVEFTLKAFQAITHPINARTYRRTNLTAEQQAECGNFGDTPTVRGAWELTRALAEALEARVVVFQSPPKFDATEENVSQLRCFFHWAERGGLRFAWEPRHGSWTDDLLRELCGELDLIHTVDPLERQSVHGSPNYFRLHGTALGGFRYQYNHPYSDQELGEIGCRCLPGPTYCLLNNIQMAADAPRLAGYLASA